MVPPWVMDEIRAHPYRMWLIQAVGLLTFTLILVYGIPANEYTVNVYPTKSPRVNSETSNKAVESKGIAVNKPVSVRPSRAPRGTIPDPLPGTPVPSARPSEPSSEPSEPSPGPSVPSDPPSAPTTPPNDQETPPVVTDDQQVDDDSVSGDSASDPEPETDTRDPLPQRVNIKEVSGWPPKRIK